MLRGKPPARVRWRCSAARAGLHSARGTPSTAAQSSSSLATSARIMKPTVEPAAGKIKRSHRELTPTPTYDLLVDSAAEFPRVAAATGRPPPPLRTAAGTGLAVRCAAASPDALEPTSGDPSRSGIREPRRLPQSRVVAEIWAPLPMPFDSLNPARGEFSWGDTNGAAGERKCGSELAEPAE